MKKFVCEHCATMAADGYADNAPVEPLNRLTGEWTNDYHGPFPITETDSLCEGCGILLPQGVELAPIYPEMVTVFSWNTETRAVFLSDGHVNVVTRMAPYGSYWESPTAAQVREWLDPILTANGGERVGRVEISYPYGSPVLSVHRYFTKAV